MKCPISGAFDFTCHDPILRVALDFVLFNYHRVLDLSIGMLCSAYSCMSADISPT